MNCSTKKRNADSFRQNLHPDLMTDLVPVRKDLVTATRASAKITLAKPNRSRVGETELHPPFNMSDWAGENLRQDVRWKFGMPPVNNANYAWIQHFIHHLSPVGVAGFVIAKTTSIGHSCSMKIAEDVRKYAADQDITAEEALQKRMEENSREFQENGAEIYPES